MRAGAVAAPAEDIDEFRAHWPLVAAAWAGLALGLASVPFYTIGIFAPILAKEFSWKFSDIMTGVTILSVCTLVFGPICGRLTDRFGARYLSIGSVLLFSLFLASFGLNQGSLALYFCSWAGMSSFGVGTTAITFTRVINLWFNRRRGLALGIAFTGSGLFGMLGKPLTYLVIEHASWRTAYFVLAALPLAIALPLMIAFLREPPNRIANVSEATRSIGETLHRWPFWLIAIAFTLYASTTGGVSVNLENILTTRGLTVPEVIRLTPLLGLCILLGRVGTGALLDRVNAVVVAVGLFLLNSLFCALLAVAGSNSIVAAIAIAAIGFSGGGAYATLSILTVRLFGMANYSSIFGVFAALAIAGPGLGGYVFGAAFDHFHGYSPALLAAGLLAVMNAASMLLLLRYSAMSEVQRPLAS